MRIRFVRESSIGSPDVPAPKDVTRTILAIICSNYRIALASAGVELNITLVVIHRRINDSSNRGSSSARLGLPEHLRGFDPGHQLAALSLRGKELVMAGTGRRLVAVRRTTNKVTVIRIARGIESAIPGKVLPEISAAKSKGIDGVPVKGPGLVQEERLFTLDIVINHYLKVII